MGVEPEKVSPSQRDIEHTSPRKQIQDGNAEDAPFRKDKAYKKFASNIKETLSSFDNKFQDWADYISFLNKLLKAVHGHPSHVSILPYKGIVAQRLAQSLSPSLPNGVHQRALDVYAYIFKLVEKEALARDLSLYFPGLSTTLSFGSLSVRSAFLAIIETHILPLPKKAIRPALKAIILSLLPGLEDETSEDFERTLILIDGFHSRFRDPADSKSESNDDGFFWQCFFLAAITSSSRSQGTLAFLNRRLPKMGNPQSASIDERLSEGIPAEAKSSILPKSIEAVVSPEPGLLVRCLASGLQHEQLLIQRGFLDLLSSHVPLHSQVLQRKVQTEDLDKLVFAATGIVLRRDTSLNRRLWNWFLGPENLSKEIESNPTSPKLAEGNESKALSGSQDSYRTLYFQTYGLSPLNRALRHEISTKRLSPTKTARPLRICQSLMDRWEIGGLVVPVIFLPAIDSVRVYREAAPSHDNFTEVLKSANVFFDGVEASLIWKDLVGLMASALSPNSRARQERFNDLAVVEFTINYFNIRDDEMLETHVPLAVLGLQAMVTNINERMAAVESLQEEEWSPICVKALGIIEKLIELLPEYHAKIDGSDREESPAVSDMQTADIMARLHDFYVKKQGGSGIPNAPFTSSTTSKLLLQQSFTMLTSALKLSTYDDQFFIKGRISITLAGKLSSSKKFPCNELYRALVAGLSADTRILQLPHKAFSLMANLAICLFALSDISLTQTSQLTALLVKHAWEFLTPSSPKFHVETVRLLWQVQQVLPAYDRQIEGILSELIASKLTILSEPSHAAEPARKFAILWSHTIQQLHTSNDSSSARSQTQSKAGSSQQRLSPSNNFEIMLSRPLFLVLDSLEDGSTEHFTFVRSWVQNMPGIEKLLQALGSKILSSEFFERLGIEVLSDSGVPISHKILEYDDLKSSLYYFRTLANILRWSSSTTWSCLSQEMILPSDRGQDSEEAALRKFDYQSFFSKVSLYMIMSQGAPSQVDLSSLKRTALSILQYIMASPFPESLSTLELEYPLIETLSSLLDKGQTYLQVPLLDCLIASLKLRLIRETYSTLTEAEIAPKQGHRRTSSRETVQSRQMSMTDPQSDAQQPVTHPPPPQLLTCMQEAFASPDTRPVLDSWISFLTEVMPLYSDVIFQVLIPLVECLCAQISLTFEELKTTFSAGTTPNSIAPESTLIAFINGLEQVLARAHDQLVTEEINDISAPGPTQTPGFFGNMVSGVFSPDSSRGRRATANDRLTVILSFQDTVRICYQIWAWGTNRSGTGAQDPASLASFAYTSLRMRNRARRMLEHLFAAESLECLEVLVDIWRADKQRGEKRVSLVFDLLHVLDGSRPKHTIPAIFNAIYSRANPNALDPMRQSTLTSDLADTDVVTFLVDYARTLEDDAMDEIWIDCMTFIKDVLLNPFPHRQTLPRLLEFTSILGEKVDNTNFGEQRRMRRELGDLFMRVLTATFTSRPMGFAQESTQPTKHGKDRQPDGAVPGSHSHSIRSDDIVSILAVIIPSLPIVLVDADRILAAAMAISTNIISPTIKSKSFPENFGISVSRLLYLVSRLPNSQKAWKKDVADAFNDPRFFTVPPSMLKSHWLRLIRQWTLGDKERMPELLSRLTAPTTAGIMFGVGANSARLEADRKAQANLRRIAILILAASDDNFVANLDAIQNKLEDLLTATAASSPSSVTRTEVFLVLRVLVLKTSAINLAPLWPIISIELQNTLSATFLYQTESYSAENVLQACKLLDVLLIIAPDDFQLHEWLFITDTIDAVYRPASFEPLALIDEISDKLGSTAVSSTEHRNESDMENGKTQSMRRPLLSPGVSKGIKQDEILSQILVPFFSHLSIHAFEGTYSMDAIDWESCRESVLIDLCDDESFGKS